MIRTQGQATGGSGGHRGNSLRINSSSQQLALRSNPGPTMPATKPDSTTLQQRANAPSRPLSMGSQQLSAASLSTSTSGLTLVLPDHPSASKSSPDRYHRNRNTLGAKGPLLPQQPMSPVFSRSSWHQSPPPAHPHRICNQDDAASPRPNAEQVKRQRRNSLSTTKNAKSHGSPSSSSAAPLGNPQQTHQTAAPSPPLPREKSCGELSSSVKRTKSTRTHDAGAWWVSQAGSRPQSPLVPARASSTTANPSSLRLQAAADTDAPGDAAKAPSAETTTEHRAVLNEKEPKGVRSRLRKTFSFDGTAELLKASTENAFLARSQHKEEDAGTNAGQESSGIYMNQSNIFSGSTDNVSISSTASSASVMLRKMGKSMRRGRSLRDIFIRKRSAKNDAADVEAEREQVNVNASSTENTRGGNSFPKSERNPLDASSSGGKVTSKPAPIIRKGILKKPVPDSLSPPPWLADRAPSFTSSLGTPASSMPSTPRDTGLEGSHYFLRGSQSSSSLPNMPPRNISFNSRIELHRAWSSSEYDRRGDVWTAHRITPQLAQAIKAEINSYKMHEMVVHESSKTYTQFYA